MAFGLDDVLFGVAVNLVSAALLDLMYDPIYAAEYDATCGGRAAYQGAIDDAMSRFSTTLGAVPAAANSDLRAFLASDDLRVLVMQLYRSRATTRTATLPIIKQGVRSLWLARQPDSSFDIDLLVEALVEACDVLLERAVRRDSVVAAHEAMSAARNAQVAERLDSIEEQLRLLRREPAVQPAVLDAFELELRAEIVARYSDNAGPYVPPRFSLSDTPENTAYERLTGQTFRMVVLGGPGAGKTTYARHLCLDLANKRHPLSGGLRVAGLLLRLRSAIDTASDLSPFEQILKGLHDLIFYELAVSDNVEALDYLLAAGRIAVVFDGLDELPTVDARRCARAGFDEFVHKYPLVPIVVTSRIVGYKHARLDQQQFRQAKLMEFDPTQIREFVEQRFGVGSSGANADCMASAFLAQAHDLQGLTSTPLLLSLLCVLFANTKNLGSTRVDLYQAFTALLAEQWEQSRTAADEAMPFWFGRSLLRRIAWLMLTRPTFSSGIRSHDVSDTAENESHRIHSISTEAIVNAWEFMEHCRGRAMIFDEVGVDADGESIFDFTHRTFLEFFAAEYVVEEFSKGHGEWDDELFAALHSLVIDSRDVVAELAIGLLAQGHDRFTRDGLLKRISATATDQEERATIDRFVEHSWE
jgi:NACHT domain